VGGESFDLAFFSFLVEQRIESLVSGAQSFLLMVSAEFFFSEKNPKK
jgi:hypothetical protein